MDNYKIEDRIIKLETIVIKLNHELTLLQDVLEDCCPSWNRINSESRIDKIMKDY